MLISLKISRVSWWKPVVGLLLLALWLGSAGFALADASQDNLKRINAHIDNALSAVKANDIARAKTEFQAFNAAWFEIEDPVRAKSKDFYVAIEDRMNYVKDALSNNPVVAKDLQAALENLNTVNLAFINGATTVPDTDDAPTATGPTPAPGATTAATSTSTATTSGTPTVASLLTILATAKEQQAKGDWDGAAATIKNFQTTWLDVEGQIKTRSVDAYKDTENDMALAYTLAKQKSADLPGVLDRMSTRLEPFKDANTYGIFDATIILLREGLEALLVVVALLAFLKKSGNDTKQSWVWSGAIAGLAASIVLGLGIQLLFSSAINSSNRELLEGTVGLVAAVMLIYVSYWMHNKSSAVAWNRYIKQRSTAALAKGSLVGLAALSFLAIFREGAETVLFFLGMGSGISAGDLFLGLAIGAILLGILGFLLVVVGVRIPMGPFFRIASILVFYLCFKFVGTGVHALQVGGIIPSTTATYLPENGFFGLFPTWETTLAQVALLLIGAGLVLYNHYKTAKEDAQAVNPVESGAASALTK
jgi:high-affinity iron transporter